jgi:hypothetical protein
MKVKVTVHTTETATFETGDLPLSLIRDLLVKNDGTFDGNYAIGDVARDDEWTTNEVIVEPLEGKAK